MSEATSEGNATTRAVLVSIVLPHVTDAEAAASLDELERLASTLGLKAVARIAQRRANTAAGTVLGAGKLRELARWTEGSGVVPSGASGRQKGAQPRPPASDEPHADSSHDGPGKRRFDDADFDEERFEAFVFGEEASEEGDRADDPEGVPDSGERVRVVLFDQELTPSQLRNLEGATSAEVLDRSSLILRIFQRHARTREARLQVEIAQLKYLAPRLRATGGGGDRQRGGIGGKGAGESALELDRRRVRDRIAELQRQLEAVRLEAVTRRERRSEQQTVALVGYTNAGKSSLMRRLTDSEVLVKDQLFATLDTTIRQLVPATKPTLLVSDTVGFIKQLPHDLVASFRSTLEEAKQAALVLLVVDAADPEWRVQLGVTRSVLSEIGADESPSLLVLNKIDRLDDATVAALAEEQPDALLMSAMRPEDIARLHARLVAFFEREMVEAELFVSYGAQRLVHRIHESTRVLREVYEDDGTRLVVRASPERVAELERMVAGEAVLASSPAPELASTSTSNEHASSPAD